MQVERRGPVFGGRGLIPPLVVATIFGGCGGPPAAEAPAKGDDAAAAGSSPAEQECIDHANGEHAKRPDEPIRIGLRHILVRHVDSKRADDSTKRSRGQACLRALEALKKLESGAEWDEVVTEYSEEKGAAARRGSLGSVTRDDLDPAFADAAFELEPDQLSYVVESPFGFHVILRTD